MKQKTFLAVAAVAIAFALSGGSQPSRAEAGGDDPLLTPVITELIAQQVLVAENQAKIEAKLALIAEDVRVARIFVGRGGGKAVAK